MSHSYFSQEVHNYSEERDAWTDDENTILEVRIQKSSRNSV